MDFWQGVKEAPRWGLPLIMWCCEKRGFKIGKQLWNLIRLNKSLKEQPWTSLAISEKLRPNYTWMHVPASCVAPTCMLQRTRALKQNQNKHAPTCRELQRCDAVNLLPCDVSLQLHSNSLFLYQHVAHCWCRLCRLCKFCSNGLLWQFTALPHCQHVLPG